MTITTITLESDDVVPVDISGLTVRVFTTGGVFVTSGLTVLGIVIFDLPDADYDLTFYKVAVSPLDAQPQRITVSAADTDDPPNSFLVIAHVTTLPESADPLLCKISGTIRRINGSATKDIRLVVGMCPELAILYGFIISPQDSIEIVPDEDGYYEFDLLRGMHYRVYFHQLVSLFGAEPAMVLAIPPNLPALDLKDLLFPVPLTAEFGVPTLALVAGADPDDSVECTITYSDGSINLEEMRAIPPLFTSFTAVSSDEDVATAIFSVDTVVVSPIAAGTALITIERTVSTRLLTYDPLPDFTTETLTVTVS